MTTPITDRAPTPFEVLTQDARRAVADLLRPLSRESIECSHAQDALGQLAFSLRQHFCGRVGMENLDGPPQSVTGEVCVMRRPAMLRRFFPAFALLGLSSNLGARPMDAYKTWVRRVRDHEFADELIVAAAAIELGIRLVCIPYTPATAASAWSISQYQPRHAETAEHRVIYLGNNDVHYVWLAQSVRDVPFHPPALGSGSK